MGGLLSRRQVLVSAAGTGLGLAALPAFPQDEAVSGVRVPRNTSVFRTWDWRDHFDDLRHGAILCDTVTRALHFWPEDESIHKVYPTSVPMSEELTRRGYTRIVYKDEAPDWSPTPSMIERDPDLPRYVGPGPDNPLGIRALRLSWQYYRIHGTNDTGKIGRRSSNGCIGLFNEHIVELFDLAKVGTQVRII